MTIYWASTKAPRDIFPIKNLTPDLERKLRESAGVDPAILAGELGLCPGHIMSFQRKLGLRKLTGNP